MIFSEQPLLGFLEAEGLRPTIEAGLRKVAPEFNRDEHEFAAAGFRALGCWAVRPTRAITRFGSIVPSTRTLRLTVLDISPEARRDTILHEVAHILTGVLVAKRENHGPRWCKMAEALGAEPTYRGRDARFHSSSQALRSSREKVVARCTGCGFEIKRLRRSSRDWPRYLHRPCGGRFEAVDEVRDGLGPRS